MFAFIDKQMVVAVVMFIGTAYLLYGSMSSGKSSSININYFHGIAIAAILSIFVAAYIDKENSIDNRDTFLKNNTVFECRNNNNLYRVSKKDAWGVDGFYFIKDSLMIRADMCEQR